MGLPKRADGVIDGTDWDTVIDAIEARLGSDATGDLLMADTTSIKTGIVDDDLFYIKAVDNDDQSLKIVAGGYGATDPYFGLGGSVEWKFYNSGTASFGTLASNWDAGAVEIRAETFESDVATGTAPFTIASTTVVTNLNADLLDGNEASAFPLSTAVVLRDGTQALTANWDAGGYYIQATRFISDVAIGTAPLTVTSTTLVSNLNADLLDGQEGSYYAVDGDVLKKDGSVALTSNWDAGGYEIRAETFESDVVTGTAPLTVASTTVVTNLNADQVDGKDETAFVLVDGTRPLTGNWDVGTYTITGTRFISDIATGTSPLGVSSTTVVTNLNSDQVDGKDSTDLMLLDGTQSLTGDWDAGSFDIRAQTGTFDSLTSGRVPFASTNGLLVDDADFTFSTDTLTVTKIAATEFTGNIDVGGNDITNIDDFKGKTNGVLTISSPFESGAGAFGVIIKTTNVTPGFAETSRLSVTGGVAIARIQVENSALNVGASTHATPVEGDLRINSNKLNVYLNGAWEVVTST